MTEVTISTGVKTLITDAKTIKMKAGYAELGFINFPSDIIASYCPYTKPSLVTSWMNKAGNVWRLRGRDEKILQVFNTALEAVRKE